MQPVELQIFFAGDAAPHTQTVVDFRLTYFREFPYLYEGNEQDEINYANSLIRHDDGFISIYLEKNKQEVINIFNPIGIFTGTPLSQMLKHFHGLDTYFQAEHDITKYYYFGELIIQPNYRGHGLAKHMLKTLCNEIRQRGYHYATLLTVDREENHPQQPINYQGSNDILWQKLGFQRTNTKIKLAWQTYINDDESCSLDNTLSFWVKKLDAKD